MTNFILMLTTVIGLHIKAGDCYNLASSPIKIDTVQTYGVIAQNWDGTELYIENITLNAYVSQKKLRQISCAEFDKARQQSQGSRNNVEQP